MKKQQLNFTLQNQTIKKPKVESISKKVRQTTIKYLQNSEVK